MRKDQPICPCGKYFGNGCNHFPPLVLSGQPQEEKTEEWEEFDKKWDDCFPFGGESRYRFQKQEIENFIRQLLQRERGNVVRECIKIVQHEVKAQGHDWESDEPHQRHLIIREETIQKLQDLLEKK